MSFLTRHFEPILPEEVVTGIAASDPRALSGLLHDSINLAGHVALAADGHFDDEIDATDEAATYATVEFVPGSTPDAFLRDPYITRALSVAVSTENPNRGFEDLPNPARAIVVLSNDAGTGAHGDGITADRRRWWYASDVPAQATATGDRCHRCTPWYEDRGPVTRPTVHTFRIARGRYVVEFALCADCQTHYDAMFLSAV